MDIQNGYGDTGEEGEGRMNWEIRVDIYTQPYIKYQGFPGCAVVKNPPLNAGDTGTMSAFRKIPRSRKWQPTSVFLPGKLHGQRSLGGYSPWGHKVSDLTDNYACAHVKQIASGNLLFNTGNPVWCSVIT